MRILKAGGNNMTSVVPLALLNGLDEVDLSNNKISEAKVGFALPPLAAMH